MLNKTTIKTVLIAGALLIATAAGAQEQSQKNREQGGMSGMDMGGGAEARRQVRKRARRMTRCRATCPITTWTWARTCS